MINLIKLSENDKRLIIVLLLVLILVFVIVGYTSLLVKKIMKIQGNKMEDLVHDVVVTGVIIDSKKLIKFGIKKNHRQLFKESWIPFLIMLFSSLVMLIYCLIKQNWSINIFDYKVEGVGTLFHIFDWDNAPKSNFFGIKIISNWPELISAPHWSNQAIPSYIFFFGMLVGGVWFLYDVQAYIARFYRLIKLSKTVFNKSLENFDPDTVARAPINPE